MLPKRTCPSCNHKTIKFISMVKNLLITNEGSKCSHCGSLILVKQSYKQTFKYLFTLINIAMFILGIILLNYFNEFTDGTILEGSLFLVFLNLTVMFSPIIISILIYCYSMPIVLGTEEEIKKRNKIYIIEISLFVIIGVCIYLFI